MIVGGMVRLQIWVAKVKVGWKQDKFKYDFVEVSFHVCGAR